MLRGRLRELNLTAPPGVLTVNPGDIIRVTTEFNYGGPAIAGTIYTALYHPSWYDPHDEIAHGTKAFSIPSSPTPKRWSGYVDIRVPSGFIGTDFGLYTKIVGVPGPDIFSPYYDNIIQIVEEVPPPPPPGVVWYPPGSYTQIGILAPGSAPAGSTVDVEVLLKNIHSDDLNMWPGRTRYNDTIFRVYDAAGARHVIVPAGQTHSWFGSFTMPNRDIRIFVESWYEEAERWYADYSVRQTVRRA